MDYNRINTFSIHYRNKFGCSVGKVALDIGMQCPNRKNGGCIYCHAPAFSPAYLLGDNDIAAQLEKGRIQAKRNKFSKYFVYFQQETSTSVSCDVLLPIIEKAFVCEHCVGVIISTRPDFIEDGLLRKLTLLLEAYDKECLFELGLQSSHQRSLDMLNRNHSVEDFSDAVRRIKNFAGLQVGAHLIFGIPGESQEDMLATVDMVAQHEVDALKLHHLQVLKNTSLYTLYERGDVSLFTRERYIELLIKMLPRIPERIVIHRLWATSHPDMLVAPKWDILATVLSRELLQIMEKKGIRQGDRYADSLN